MQNVQEKAKNVGCTCINPTPDAHILHPILHPKLSVNTGHLAPWCRKCRRFSKTFFVEGGKGECDVAVRKMQNIGLLWAKVRMFCLKSTDVFIKEVRCFCFPGKSQLQKTLPPSTGNPSAAALPPQRLVSSLVKGRSAENVTLQPSPSMPGMGGTSLRTLTLAARTMGKATRIAWSKRPQRCSRS